MIKRPIPGFFFIFLFLTVGTAYPSPGERKDAEKEIITLHEGHFLASQSAHPPDFSSPESQSVTLPDIWEESRYKNGRSGWYRFLIKKEHPPETVWAVYLPKLNMNAAIYFNGHFLGDGGSFEEPLGRNWNRPLLFSISPKAWISGENTLLIRLAGYPVNIKLAPVQIGPLPLLQRAYKMRKLFQNQIISALFPVTLTISIFMLTLGFRRERETLYIWFGLSVLTWAASSLNLFVRDIPVKLRSWEVLSYASFLWWNHFQALFVLRFLHFKRPCLEKFFFLQAITGTLFLCFSPLEKMMEISQIWSVAGLLIGGYYTTLTLRQWLSKKQKEAGILGIALILIWLTTFHDWLHLSSYFPITEVTALFLNHYTAPLIFLFMAWHITSRFITALDESDRLNRELENRIEEAKRELEVGHQKILEMGKKEVLVEERSRISREIHDGLGGNFSNAITLVDLITRESSGRSTQGRLRHLRAILTGSFTELRNLIIAMEDEVATLETLTSHMNEKTRKIAELASLDCDSSIDIGDGVQHIPQKFSLNLLRILQEGLTNTVRHAQASRIELCVAFRSGTLFFSLRDDGRGFVTKEKNTGHGLRNIRRRCQDMGVELTIASAPGEGTCLSLGIFLDQRSGKTL
ncbi:MAG: ATP-binding protein [Nitrospiria bacterium]